jgi:hypothetical protein
MERADAAVQTSGVSETANERSYVTRTHLTNVKQIEAAAKVKHSKKVLV